jgi:hypothetical protein
MHLRLKSNSSLAPRPTHELGLPEALPRGLRSLLFSNHLSSFDWRCGGPVGPIKFIDLRELEYALLRAEQGDVNAAPMAQLYLRAMGALIATDNGAACQYSIGDRCNSNSRQFTLAGQALMLQAIGIGAALGRRKSLANVAMRIHRFVARSGDELAPHPSFQKRDLSHISSPISKLRDRCWYARAMHQFGTA